MSLQPVAEDKNAEGTNIVADLAPIPTELMDKEA